MNFCVPDSGTRTDIGFIKEKTGQIVTIKACVHKIKKMSGFVFIILRTGKFLLQCVYNKDECNFSIDDLSEGCYVTASGLVKTDDRAPNGIEISLKSLTILTTPYKEYPLKVSAKKIGCSLEVNLNNRSVALRNPYEKAVFSVSDAVCRGFREFMHQNGFTEIHTPKIVSSGAEGGANIFKLDYFGTDAFLAQSPQLYKQMCVAFFDRVYEIGPVFRAEKHSTSRHLNEYTGLDFEMGFIDSMYDVMKMEAAMLKYVVEYLENECQDELKLLERKLPKVSNIPSVTFDEAMKLISKNNRYDLDPADEVELCKLAKKEFDSDFIFVTHFPTAKRPFYAMDDPQNPQYALSFDLLLSGLEITTGGQRVHDYQMQVDKMKRMGLNPDLFESYLSIHKYGMPPHGGLGIGLERLVMKLLDLQNVRQASLFPRDILRLDP